MTGARPFPALSRRRMIQSLGGGLGALGLAQLLADRPAAAAQQPHFAPRAKRVIQLFMNGGPFQADFFDPKPALKKYEGQRPAEVQLRTERATAGLLPSPFAFRPRGESGVEVSELLPRLGACIDDICVLRSLHTDNPNHGPALFLMNNGSITPNRPSMGAWFSYGLGTENRDLPGYVVLCPGRPVRFSELWTSSFLPGEHQGTYINHSELDPRKMIPHLRNAEIDPERQRRQLDLMRRLNEGHLDDRGPDPALEARLKAMESAFRMQFQASEAFDIAREPQSVREEYGDGHFAHACLLARRLAERGVRFIQVYHRGWDHHNDVVRYMDVCCRLTDRPAWALVTDLKQRGLLDETLVIWGGEFGRTPMAKTTKGQPGRDHHIRAFSIWMAGGGVKPGITYGATDDLGYYAVEDTAHVRDLHATMLHLLGLDHRRLKYKYQGLDFRLTGVEEEAHVLRPVLA
jgi:hypothetical protein